MKTFFATLALGLTGILSMTAFAAPAHAED